MNNKTEDIDADNHFFCAALCLFQHASLQFITLTTSKGVKKKLSSRRRATRMQAPVWGSLSFYDLKSHDRIHLILQFSSDTSTRRNAKLGKFWDRTRSKAGAALDLALGSIDTQMPGPTPGKISHRILLLAK